MQEQELIKQESDSRKKYEAPQLIQKGEIVIELQTNYLPDEPPPPL